MDAPIPDDLGVEKSYLTMNVYHPSNHILPGFLHVTDADAPRIIKDKHGVIYTTSDWPEGGFVYG